MHLDPDMARILATMAPPDPQSFGMTLQDRRLAFLKDQAVWNKLEVAGVSTVDLEVRLTQRVLKLRLFRPEGRSSGLVVYAHGGGWVFGNLDTHKQINALLAQTSRTALLAIDYRLSPEHPFPAPVDDFVEVAEVVNSGLIEVLKEYRTRPMVFVGDSAGAHLALSAALKLKGSNKRTFKRLAGLVLFYGCYQRRFDTSSHMSLGHGEYVLTTDSMRYFWDQLTSGLADPSSAEPLSKTLYGLPPTKIIAAELDPLLDDSLELHDELYRHGVSSTLKVVPGVVHAFLKYSSQLYAARSCLATTGSWIRHQLDQSHTISASRGDAT